jgi:hypothetical protein
MVDILPAVLTDGCWRSRPPAPRQPPRAFTPAVGGTIPNPARLQRLSKRGFIKKREDEELRVTVKGRAALLLGRR